MSESIEHPGIVEQVDGSKVRVRITQYSACAGCHAKSACTISDRKDKWIDVEDASGDYHTGEAVVIVGENSLGREAVLLAFVLPGERGIRLARIGTLLHYIICVA